MSRIRENTKKALFLKANINDNDVGSMMVPFGTTVTLYENDSWSGKQMTWVGRPYIDANETLLCIDFLSQARWADFNDKISSARVYKS